MNPGRVGLIAVDSMAMGTPIITRKLAGTHAPEIEYLDNPKSILIAENDLDDYVTKSVLLLNNPQMKREMSNILSELSLSFSAEEMARNFHLAVKANL